ncbi:MAG: DUF4255 domain-containing protein [Fimbriimonadaceae bacterium]|nr:DUF4255 domain-containing protein [Fimbriimonadaceae bacterium]QOJ12711.1 MAG: DUF4255 domain-containing protein [Chthonomonadaceae bacterium]
MIHEVDVTLRELLLGEMKAAGAKLLKDAAQVGFGLPGEVKGDSAKSPQVNLYLHDVRENLSLRDESIKVVRNEFGGAIGKVPAPIRLDLSYLVTVHAGGDSSVEHELLAEVISVFIRNRWVPERYLTEGLKPFGSSAVIVSVAQSDHPSQSDPSSLWSALGGQVRPMLGLVVTAMFNPFETKLVKMVREAIVGIGVGTPPQGPDRPLDLKTTRVSAAGIVTRGEDDLPEPEVVVSVAGREERTTTDERGFFCLLNLPPGKHTLSFWKRGLKVKEVAVNAPPPGRPDLLDPIGVSLDEMSDKERQDEQKELARAAQGGPGIHETLRKTSVTITGRLRYSDGQPAAYIPVSVGDKSSMTDGEGFYRFTNLAPGPHKVLAQAPGQDPVEVAVKDGAATLPAAAGKK